MFFFYRIVTFLLFPIFIVLIYLRRFFNKEDKIRYKEKFFIDKDNLPKNKKVIWIHAASIGETNSVISLVENIIKENKDIFILLTTTTLSSSQLIKKKINFSNFHHRFFCIDITFLVKKFLNTWKPEIVIFVDSEVWPNYILEITKRKIPLILLNGRITMKTFNRWKIFPNFSKKIFSSYNLCLSASSESENNLKSLGAKNVKFVGNLKFSSNVRIPIENNNFSSLFKNYFTWCAASTHPDEEKIILKTHMELKKKGVKVVTVIIPRHILRCESILSLCKNLNLDAKIVRDSDSFKETSEIVIINSFGEMNKYFNYCKSIFMGKSISRKLIKVGGQNPIEPAKCGCKIYHGPFISNFKEIYDLLREMKISKEINNELDLSSELLKDYQNLSSTNKDKIERLNTYGKKILSNTKREIMGLIK